WTERIARVARGVLATDASAEVLAIARAKSLPEDRVRFEIADAFAPHAIEGSFSAAFAGFFWSHVARERVAGWLGAIHRRLGPGARLVAVDNRYVAQSSTPVARVDAAGNAY